MEEFIPIFFMMCVAGVLILRPVTKRLGLLIEAFARERTAGSRPVAGLEEVQVARLTTALERLNTRMDLIDDRIGFMERLVESRSDQRLTG